MIVGSVIPLVIHPLTEGHVNPMAYPHVYMAVGIVTHRVTFWGREFYGEIEHEG